MQDGLTVKDEVVAQMVEYTPEQKTDHQITVHQTTGTVQCSCGAEWVWVAGVQQTCPNDKR